ncbi:fimbrial protein [Klebsiella pneumoniae]|uniref:fimbrial protein n=1 Tax=Klebsiella pneumoniae TaxID=573 RepID=UPI003F6DF6B4
MTNLKGHPDLACRSSVPAVSLVPLNQVSQVWSGKKGSQTNYRLSYQARYIQTQPAVTAGEANASATFVVTYN